MAHIHHPYHTVRSMAHRHRIIHNTVRIRIIPVLALHTITHQQDSTGPAVHTPFKCIRIIHTTQATTNPQKPPPVYRAVVGSNRRTPLCRTVFLLLRLLMVPTTAVGDPINAILWGRPHRPCHRGMVVRHRSVHRGGHTKTKVTMGPPTEPFRHHRTRTSSHREVRILPLTRTTMAGMGLNTIEPNSAGPPRP